MSRNEAPAPGAHRGLVVALEGDSALVQFARSSMCAHCGGCLAVGEKRMQTRVKNTLQAQVGDMVSVTIEARNIVLASLLAYCIPLGLLVAGLYVGSLISEAASAAIGLTLCAGGFAVLRILEPHLRAKQGFLPRMQAILEQEEENNGESEHTETLYNRKL